MRRIALALLVSLLALMPIGGTALAKCPTCVDGVSVQTPDGQPWSAGKPITLVVSARRGAPGTEFPTNGLAVVMRTDGDRTKCLDVPLRLVSRSGDSALYAGVFYPFRVAAYDGRLQLGDDIFDIRFDMRSLAPTTAAARAAELPTGSVEEPYLLDYARDAVPFALTGAGIALALGLATLMRRRRIVRPAFAS